MLQFLTKIQSTFSVSHTVNTLFGEVTLFNLNNFFLGGEALGGVVVKALHYKPAGRGFDSRWCHWNFSVT